VTEYVIKLLVKLFRLPMFVAEMCAGWKKTDLVLVSKKLLKVSKEVKIK